MNELDEIALKIRRDVVEIAHNAGTKGAHLGGSLSVADILAVLFGAVMKYDPANPMLETRDRLIISKAHAGMALYGALHQVGFLTDEDISGALQVGSAFYEHPRMDISHGIEFSGGSLGQGLSFAVGTALAMKMKKNPVRVYAIIGDGECNEGQIWEAAIAAAHFQLDNLWIIIDVNRLQYDGYTDEIMGIHSLLAIWEKLGYVCYEIDGHSTQEIEDVLLKPAQQGKPTLVYANTIKGKGISFAENRVEWHTAYLNDDLYAIALEELS